MMGQPRQTGNTYSVEDDLDKEERRGARYIYMNQGGSHTSLTVSMDPNIT
jgi:hypothetical protein